MYNKPAGTIRNISIGPGILLLGPVGSTPVTDFGFVTGDVTFTVKREQSEIRQGSPQTLIGALVKSEDIMLEIKGIEWNMDSIAKSLGDGATSLSGASSIFKVGGTPNVNTLALRFLHKMADGGCMIVDIWKCICDGNLDAAINADKPHELKIKFKAIDPGATDWAGAALTDGQKLAKITNITP